MQHWILTREADGLARLVVRQGRRDDQHAVGRGARGTQRGARRARPRSAEGPRHRVGQGERLHRRRRHRRIRRRSKTEADAIALVKRGWDTFERLAAVELSDARAGPRLLPGRRPRAGARVPLSRRRRRAGHAARPARSDARHRARLGRHEAAAAARRRAGGARPAAHRQDDRCAPREEARHRRRMRAAADHGEHRARRADGAAAAAHAAVSAVADAESARARDSSPRRRESRSRSARGASTIRRRTRSSTCG